MNKAIPGLAVRTLAIGAAGAAMAWILSFPAPYLTGPAIAVTVAGLAGLSTEVPGSLRNAVFVIIGLVMGQSVTPQVIEAVAHWPVTLAAMAIMLVVIIFITRKMLMQYWGMDPMTGVLCSSPGHLSYVLGLTEGVNADLRTVSIVQSIRVLCLTLIVPVVVITAGPLPQIPLTMPHSANFAALALMAILAAAAGWVLNRLKIPAAYLIGGLMISAVFHATDMIPGTVPRALTMGAYITMGSLIGTRFSGVTMTELKRSIGAGLAVTAVAVIIAGVFAGIAAEVTGFNLMAVLIAFAPGGVETMSAMSVLLGLDPTFVAAHHVARLLMLTLIVPFFVLRRKAA